MNPVAAGGALEGKRILLLGASGDLGGAVARHLSATGAELLLSGRNSGRLAELSSGTGAQVVPADLLQEEGRAGLVGACGELDGLVDAAGVAPLAPVRYLKAEAFSSCLNINTAAPVYLVRDLLRARKLGRNASIVFISSVAATAGTVGYAAYSASKAALEAAARSLAAELASRAVRVNCIAAGMVRGRMAEAAGDQISEEELEAHLQQYPLGPGDPVDVAAAVAFLLGPGSRWMTGTRLVVDGGYGLAR